MCHVCPGPTRCHSQYNAVKEQYGPLFLSERKTEQLVCPRLVAPRKGWVLLGTSTCLYCLPQGPTAAPLPRPLAPCAWGGWRYEIPPCSPVMGMGLHSSFRKPPSGGLTRRPPTPSPWPPTPPRGRCPQQAQNCHNPRGQVSEGLGSGAEGGAEGGGAGPGQLCGCSVPGRPTMMVNTMTHEHGAAQWHPPKELPGAPGLRLQCRPLSRRRRPNTIDFGKDDQHLRSLACTKGPPTSSARCQEPGRPGRGVRGKSDPGDVPRGFPKTCA